MKHYIIAFIVITLLCSCSKYRVNCNTDEECDQMMVGKWHMSLLPGTGGGIATRIGYCENGRYIVFKTNQKDASIEGLCTLVEPDTTYFLIRDLAITHYHLRNGDTLFSNNFPILKLTKSRLIFLEDNNERKYSRKE